MYYGRKMINAAIFDMDGTFLDSMPYWMNAGENFLESLQIQAEENLGEKLLDMTLQDGACAITIALTGEETGDSTNYHVVVPAEKGAVSDAGQITVHLS